MLTICNLNVSSKNSVWPHLWCWTDKIINPSDSRNLLFHPLTHGSFFFLDKQSFDSLINPCAITFYGMATFCGKKWRTFMVRNGALLW